jgi:hypothetical protein
MANINSAFEATGFAPFNPMKPLNSQFVHDYPSEIYKKLEGRSLIASESLLTSERVLQMLCQEERDRNLMEQDWILDLPEILESLMKNSVETGRAISAVPDLLAEYAHSVLRRIKMPKPQIIATIKKPTAAAIRQMGVQDDDSVLEPPAAVVAHPRFLPFPYLMTQMHPRLQPSH